VSRNAALSTNSIKVTGFVRIAVGMKINGRKLLFAEYVQFLMPQGNYSHGAFLFV